MEDGALPLSVLGCNQHGEFWVSGKGELKAHLPLSQHAGPLREPLILLLGAVEDDGISTHQPGLVHCLHRLGCLQDSFQILVVPLTQLCVSIKTSSILLTLGKHITMFKWDGDSPACLTSAPPCPGGAYVRNRQQRLTPPGWCGWHAFHQGLTQGSSSSSNLSGLTLQQTPVVDVPK